MMLLSLAVLLSLSVRKRTIELRELAPAHRQVNAEGLLREVQAAEEQLHVGAGILRLFSEGRVWND